MRTSSNDGDAILRNSGYVHACAGLAPRLPDEPQYMAGYDERMAEVPAVAPDNDYEDTLSRLAAAGEQVPSAYGARREEPWGESVTPPWVDPTVRLALILYAAICGFIAGLMLGLALAFS